MKKVIFFIILITPMFCFCQPLLGVGELKLGKSFNDLKNALNLNVYTINSDKRKQKELRRDNHVLYSMPFSFEYDQYPNSVFRIDKQDDPLAISSSKEILDRFDSSTSQELYFLPKYKIASLELSNIYLLFRNNKLVFIDIGISSDLITALKEKYPPTKNIDKTDTIKCTYTFTGAETNNLAFKQNVIWKSDVSYCEYLFDKSFTSDCKPMYLSYFRIYDLPFYKEEEKYQLSTIDKMVKSVEQKNKSLLDSL